jgi:hypothetical protein
MIERIEGPSLQHSCALGLPCVYEKGGVWRNFPPPAKSQLK